jgi:transposase
MERFIGLDVHAQSCTFGVIDAKGKQLRTDVVETNGQSLVEYVRLIPGRRHLCLEEGTHSQWLSEILARHVHELAVIWAEKKRGNKNDTIDAFGLAERMRTGALGRKIFKAPETFTPLRDSARVYAMVTKDVVRTKNRIKSFYRSRGVQTPNRKTVFSPAGRSAALVALKPATRQAVEVLCKQLDSAEEVKAEAQKAMIAQARKHTIAKKLETAPGLGPVRVAQLLAIVVSPHRFRTSRQFWAYCGLGIVMRSSADWVQTADGDWVKAESAQTRGLNRNCNRIAKAIFKGAATTVISQMHNTPLCEDYRRLLDQGTKPNLAKLTIARKIAAITLAMWKTKEAYNPTKHRKQVK